MRPLADFPLAERQRVRYVLTDIDDTITTGGRIPAAAYAGLERLRDAGLAVVPITGRPAGWCDHIARMWPVAGVVGENGAMYFRYDEETRKMIRGYWKPAEERIADRERLNLLRDEILAAVPGAALSADQPYREADVAIDFCEDVAPLSDADIDRIVELFEAAGATAKVSSIHVNGWFGAYDKLSMTRRFFADAFGVDLDAIREQVVFAGDSPNDEPMFAYFPNAVGVANVADGARRMQSLPRWVTQSRGGEGFAELAEAIVSAHQGSPEERGTS